MSQSLREFAGRCHAWGGGRRSRCVAACGRERPLVADRRAWRAGIVWRLDRSGRGLGSDIRNAARGHGECPATCAPAASARRAGAAPGGFIGARDAGACARGAGARARGHCAGSSLRRPSPVSASTAARYRRWCRRSPPRTSRAPIRLTWSRRSRSAFPASAPTTSRATNSPRTYATAASRLRRCRERRRGSPSTCKASASTRPSAIPSTGT